MDPRLVPALREIDVPFREDEPIARHTSMGVGGPAAVMAFPRDAATRPRPEWATSFRGSRASARR